MGVVVEKQARGVVLSLFASSLFGVTFYLSGVVDASPTAVFGWRMVITAVLYLLVLFAVAARRRVRDLWERIVARKSLIAVLLCTSFLAGSQMWLFTWAPANDFGLDTSLGYLLLPIGLVLVGRIGFSEAVSGAQWIAVGIAVVAVAVKLVATGSLSWVTFAVVLGYGLYFGVRRRFALEGPEVFGAEVMLMLPVTITFIVMLRGAPNVGGHLLVLLISVLGAIAMSSYVGSAGMLSLPMFGLLSYAEPVGLFCSSLVLGEKLSPSDAVVYGLLAVALGVLAVAGFRSSGGRTPQDVP
ncbi:MAG: EamA family transporter RarD [Gordonia sp. (in: high G+C Gram-positive bacteria)]